MPTFKEIRAGFEITGLVCGGLVQMNFPSPTTGITLKAGGVGIASDRRS